MIVEDEQGVEEGWDAGVANNWGVWDGKGHDLEGLDCIQTKPILDWFW